MALLAQEGEQRLEILVPVDASVPGVDAWRARFASSFPGCGCAAAERGGPCSATRPTTGGGHRRSGCARGEPPEIVRRPRAGRARARTR